MLVLTRSLGEMIRINDNIEIVMLSTRDGIATIGINAPKEVKVLREELVKSKSAKANKAPPISSSSGSNELGDGKS